MTLSPAGNTLPISLSLSVVWQDFRASRETIYIPANPAGEPESDLLVLEQQVSHGSSGALNSRPVIQSFDAAIQPLWNFDELLAIEHLNSSRPLDSGRPDLMASDATSITRSSTAIACSNRVGLEVHVGFQSLP